MVKILVCILLQFVLFIPFYFIWRNDCKKIGKERLAVSLGERFVAWLILCPIWIGIFLD
jgi:hypothetical protein